MADGRVRESLVRNADPNENSSACALRPQLLQIFCEGLAHIFREGVVSRCPPLPRMVSSPASQSISSSVMCTIQRHVSRVELVGADRPIPLYGRVISLTLLQHGSTCWGNKYLGSPARLQLATDGTDAARFVAMSPRCCRNRSKLRRALAIQRAACGLMVLAWRSMQRTMSCAFSSLNERIISKAALREESSGVK